MRLLPGCVTTNFSKFIEKNGMTSVLEKEEREVGGRKDVLVLQFKVKIVGWLLELDRAMNKATLGGQILACRTLHRTKFHDGFAFVRWQSSPSLGRKSISPCFLSRFTQRTNPLGLYQQVHLPSLAVLTILDKWGLTLIEFVCHSYTH
ncbi:hypothetical protein M0802_008087 [Mischocyttarus mexicanus]|nr:hypothetical protein M0802_008087 [Mischocyttarus mexicanus]